MIERLSRLQTRLTQLQKEPSKVVVVVGFKANYAIYVHENVAMKWKGLPRGAGFTIDKKGRVLVSKKVLTTGVVDTHGQKGFYWDPQGKAQAKFLEEPARTMQPELAEVVRTMYQRTKSLSKSLFAAGLRLQREAQQRVPVDTGNLKNSAFTEFE